MTNKQIQFLNDLAIVLDKYDADISLQERVVDNLGVVPRIMLYIPHAKGDDYLELSEFIYAEGLRKLCDSSRLADTRPSETKQGEE